MTEVSPKVGQLDFVELGHFVINPFILHITKYHLNTQLLKNETMSVQSKDSQRILNVGVVGCGEVAQIVHVRFFQFSLDIPIHMTRGLMGSYLISCLLLICIDWLRFVMSRRSYLGIVGINSMFRKNIDMGICTFFSIPLVPSSYCPCSTSLSASMTPSSSTERTTMTLVAVTDEQGNDVIKLPP